MGVVSSIHLNEELTNSSNITMHRDATTIKGETILCLILERKIKPQV